MYSQLLPSVLYYQKKESEGRIEGENRKQGSHCRCAAKSGAGTADHGNGSGEAGSRTNYHSGAGRSTGHAHGWVNRSGNYARQRLQREGCIAGRCTEGLCSWLGTDGLRRRWQRLGRYRRIGRDAGCHGRHDEHDQRSHGANVWAAGAACGNYGSGSIGTNWNSNSAGSIGGRLGLCLRADGHHRQFLHQLRQQEARAKTSGRQLELRLWSDWLDGQILSKLWGKTDRTATNMGLRLRADRHHR